MFKLFNLIYIILVLTYLILPFPVSSISYSELDNDTSNIKNYTKMDNNFIVKFSSRGGFAWHPEGIFPAGRFGNP